MSSTSALEALPVEVLLHHVAKYLTADSLAKLSRVSKYFNALITPLIWSDIELHEVGYHESRSELNIPAPHRRATARPYHPEQPWGAGQGARMKAENLFTMLQVLHDQDIEQLKTLTRRVKHLCTTIQPSWSPRNRQGHETHPDPIQVWQLLPYFSNLETLELHGDSCYSAQYEQVVQEIKSPVPRLRFLKLAGYVPRAISAWALLSGSTLERLEIGMLDRPISTSLSYAPDFKPLPEENLAASDDDESDYGSLYAEAVIPRPLGGALPTSTDLVLPKLKHLYLYQPAPSNTHRMFMGYGWSKRAESACLGDWRRLLLASRNTLEVLVLEQRPAAAYIEGDGSTELEWMESKTDPDAHVPLIEMVKSALIADEAPQLKSVYMYGIDVSQEGGEPSGRTAAGRFMKVLKEQGVKAEARLGKWCYFDNSPGVVYWAGWQGSDDDEEDEDEDDDENDDENRMQEGERNWESLLVSI